MLRRFCNKSVFLDDFRTDQLQRCQTQNSFSAAHTLTPVIQRNYDQFWSLCNTATPLQKLI